MKRHLLLILSLLYYFVANAQLYTLKDTLRADSLTIPLTSKQRLCGCPNEWLQQYGEAYAIYKATLTDRHKKTAGALLNLTKSYYVSGNTQKALSLAEQAVTSMRSLVPLKDSTLFPYLLLYADIKLNYGASQADLMPLIEEVQAIAFRYNDGNGKILKINWFKQVKQWLPWGLNIKGLPDDLDKTLYEFHSEVYGKNDPKTVKALMIWGQSLNSKEDKDGHNKIEEAARRAETFKETAPNEYFEILDIITSPETDRDKMIRGIQNNLLYLNQQCGEKGACLDRDGQRISLITYDHYRAKNISKKDYNTLWALYTNFIETTSSNPYKLGVYSDLATILQSKASEQQTMGDTVAFKEYYQNALRYALLTDSIARYQGVAARHKARAFMAQFYNAMKEPLKAIPYLKQIKKALIESDTIMLTKGNKVSRLYSEFQKSYTLLGKKDSVVYYAERNVDVFNTDSTISNLFNNNINLKFYYHFGLFALYLKTNRTQDAENLWQKWTAPDGLLTQNPCLKGTLVLQVQNLVGIPQCFDFFKTHHINLEDEALLLPCNTVSESALIPLIIGYLLNESGKKQAAVKVWERIPQLYNISYDSLDNRDIDVLSILVLNHFLLSETCGELSQNTALDKTTQHLYTQKAFHNAESAYRIVDVFRRDVRNTPWEGSKENPDYPVRYIIWNAVKYALALKNFSDVPFARNAQIDKAFQYSEIARAKTLLEFLLYREAISHKPASNDTLSTLIYQDTLLQNILIAKELDMISLSMGSNIASKQLKKLQNEIVALKFDIDLIQSQLKQKLDIKLKDNIVSIPQVQAALKPDEALIEYLWDKTALHTFIIKKDTFWATTMDSVKDFEGLISRYLDLLQDKSNLGLSARLNKKADSLWQYLFLPLDTALLPSKLIIVPHRTMALLPFEALRDGHNYLIEKYAIRYAYSATTLLKMQNLDITNNGFVGFAPFATPLTLSSSSRQGVTVTAANVSRNEDFVPLPETKKELDTIKTIMGGKAYYYQEATKDKFKQEAVKYAYIHLPTHAESPDNNSARIAFFNHGKTTWDKTSALYGREIYNLKFNADLISLSACETYGTKQNNDDSEGIMGLARGFSQAGVKSVVATLWVVDAEKTSQFMTQFYQNLKKGISKSAALRQVKRQMIQHKETAHPYFWAAPILIGDSGDK